MRIAWFTHRYHPCIGGAETYGRQMVRRFTAGGHAVDVHTSDAHDLWYFTDRNRRRVDAPPSEIVDGAMVHRFAVQHIPMQKYVGRLLSYSPHWPTRCKWESYMPIIPTIERVRGDYDLVFGVGFPFTLFSYAALQTARAAGAPLVLTPFLHLATPGDPVRKHYTRPHQARLLRAADLVVAATELEARAMAEWGIARSNVLVLGMGVEHDLVTGGDPRAIRAKLGIPDGRAVIGQLGALDPNKGTCDLVRAVARLNENRADNPIHLILAGAASPDFEAFRASLPPSAERWLAVLGVLPDDQRRDFHAALDIFAMPSRTDSFGIVFLEAWANAKPVVAAAAGGVAEVVEHDRNGLLVPFGDVAALAGALGTLSDDPDRAKRLGAAGRERVAHGHSWDDRFATLSERAISLRGAHRARSA